MRISLGSVAFSSSCNSLVGDRSVIGTRTTKSILVRSAAIVLALMSALSVHAAVINSTWIGSDFGSWGTSGNWSPSGVPNNGGADAYNVSIAPSGGGIHNIQLDLSPTINDFTFGGDSATPRIRGAVGSSGDQSLTVNGLFVWHSGTLSSSFVAIDYNVNGGGMLDSTSDVALEGGFITRFILDGFSTFTHSGSGSVVFTDDVFFNIRAGSAWENTASGGFGATSPSPFVLNEGTFRKMTSSGTAAINTYFENLGTVSVEAGTLSFARTYSQSGGILDLNGGNVHSTLGLFIGGGLVTGSGSITGGGLQLGSATVAPGHSAGTLTLSSLSANASSTFSIELGGLTAGLQYDQIQVTGTATVNGNLNVVFINGFENSITTGDAFSLVSAAGGLNGTFTGLPDGAVFTVNGIPFEADYTPNEFILTVVPEPTTYATLTGIGLTAFAALRRAVMHRR